MSKEKGCKIVLLGDGGVGKTCIISRYISGQYDGTSAATNGASYCSKSVNFSQLNKTLLLDVWDTAGQERYRALTKFFYKDAAVCILVYDITKRKTFDNLKSYWYEQLKENSGKNIVVGIAGNKCDLYEEEEVSEDEARQFAESVGAVFELTSAQNNTGINELFLECGYKYLDPNFKPSSEGPAPTPENINETRKEENRNDTKKEDKNNIVLEHKDFKRDKKKKACC
jgi:small GTP-binding protein